MDAKKERAFPDDGTDYLLSISETASRLRTSRNIVMRLVKAKLLKPLMFRKECRIPRSVFNQFIKDNLGKDIYAVLESAEAV